MKYFLVHLIEVINWQKITKKQKQRIFFKYSKSKNFPGIDYSWRKRNLIIYTVRSFESSTVPGTLLIYVLQSPEPQRDNTYHTLLRLSRSLSSSPPHSLIKSFHAMLSDGWHLCDFVIWLWWAISCLPIWLLCLYSRIPCSVLQLLFHPLTIFHSYFLFLNRKTIERVSWSPHFGAMCKRELLQFNEFRFNHFRFGFDDKDDDVCK